MTWKDCNLVNFFEIPWENRTINHIILLNIESGIAWNPFGKKMTVLGEWTWCNEAKNISQFIEVLSQRDYLCILHSEYKETRPVIDEMQSRLSKPIMAVIGLNITSTVYLLREHWNKFIKCPANLNINAEYLSIPSHEKIGGSENTDIPFLTIPKSIPTEKTMIILVGQPGCGKTTYANQLQKHGFIIINENECRLIKSGLVKSIDNLKNILESDIKGVVIDSNNCKHIDREYFANIAKNLKIKVIIHWITKPGFRFNNNRLQKTPEIELETYSTNLESPGLFDIDVFIAI